MHPTLERLQDANSLIGTLSPLDFAKVQPPQACESVLFLLQTLDGFMSRQETKCTFEDL